VCPGDPAERFDKRIVSFLIAAMIAAPDPHRREGRRTE
jgi:hypothetical protein